MRRWIKTLLLATVFAVLLCTSALAVDSNSGIHSIWVTDSSEYAVVAQTKDKADVTTTTTVSTDGGDLKIYAETERVKLTITGTDAGKQYLVFVLTEQKVPTAGNIVYIDQQEGTGTGSELVFELYPSSLSSGTTYYIYVSSTGAGLQAESPVGSFQYYAPYMLGDVTGDKRVRSNDATRVLNHAVGNITLTGNDFKAADVTKDGRVRTNDATKILNFAVGNITSFD